VFERIMKNQLQPHSYTLEEMFDILYYNLKDKIFPNNLLVTQTSRKSDSPDKITSLDKVHSNSKSIVDDETIQEKIEYNNNTTKFATK